MGFRPPDEKWQKMKLVYDACVSAGIPIPDEVYSFFDGEAPDNSGVEVDISKIVKEWGDDSRSGFEIELSLLPKDVKVLRFYNSW